MDNKYGGFFCFQGIYRQFDDGRYLKESAGVDEGNMLIIKGPSGSGKSTLLRILARLLKPDGGEIYWRGKNWREYSPLKWRNKIQYVSQKPIVFPGTVRDNLEMPFRLNAIKAEKDMDLKAALIYMEKMGISPSVLDQEAKTLSGGEAARIAIIRAFIIEPEILLLDEPTAFLDHDNKAAVLQTIDNWVIGQKRAAIIVSHQEEDLKYLRYQKILRCLIRKAD